MKYKQSVIFIVICWFLTPVAGLAEEMRPLDIAKQIQQTYEKTVSLKADFIQSSTVRGIRHRQRQGRGTMVIQKPGLLRWDYTIPDQQVLVSDGESFSLYFSSENQMIITPAKEYLQEDVTYNFFSGNGNILEDFDVEAVSEDLQVKGYYALQLTPRKSHAQVETLFAWVEEKTFHIKRLQILDHLGSTTDLQFSNVVVNHQFPADFFHFTPPEGTEIISQ